MRRLIVCCDGTWNTPEDETVTNVRRLFNALDDVDDEGHAQVAYYHPGVGTEGNLLYRLLGAGTGAGLSRNIIDAYHWLTTRYEPGDRITVFGFSRGAYTARSLVGMISACGLIEAVGMDEATTWSRIERVYDEGYRRRGNRDRWRARLSFRFDPRHSEQIPVDFVGVWDTVGALGIPDYLGWLNLLDPPHRYDFHDLTLNPYIAHGRHAVAADERRGPYAPSLWSEPYAAGQDVKQVWFPGSHKDVGGGHLRMGLSDGALLWMMDEAREAVRLGFRKTTVDQVRADPLDILHDDDHGAFGLFGPIVDPMLEPWLEVFLQPRPRAVPLIDPNDSNPSVHPSVYQRQLTIPITSGPYRPTRVLAPGEAATVDVLAREPWNETGLYLDPGDYVFTAEGEWLDGRIASGPGGTTGLIQFNPFTERLRLLGRISARVEDAYRRVTGNKTADLVGSPRASDLPWMSLVGVVANDLVAVKGAFRAHELIAVGTGTRHHVSRSGYLYAFANDAWGFYANNDGLVRLTVTRLPDDA